MLSPGGYYYVEQRFDLALNYDEKSYSYDFDTYVCLVYIWYCVGIGEVTIRKSLSIKVRRRRKGILSCNKNFSAFFGNWL
jgi:hypothetical protein